METNRIDQLFREKLETQPSSPDPQAWNELELLLDKKNKKAVLWYYKIAASIVLILTAGVVTYEFMGQEQSVTSIATVGIKKPSKGYIPTEVTSEQIGSIHEQKNDLSIQEPVFNKKSPVVVEPEKKVKKQAGIVVSNQKNYVAVIGDDDEIRRLKEEGAVIIELDDIDMSDIGESIVVSSNLGKEENVVAGKGKNKRSVKITYKSSQKIELTRRVVIIAKLDTMRRWKPDLKNILKAPGNFLADVRDAKDFLFNPKDEFEETKNLR